MSKQAKRIFDCRPLIEEILHRDIDKYEPCDDEAVNGEVKELMHREAASKADIFVLVLYAIAHEMDFSDWQDFWLDMGIRVFCDEQGDDNLFSIDLYDYCND